MEALVIKSTGKDYILNYGGQKIISKVRGKMRLDMIRTTNPIAVGDIVEFEFETPQTGIITSVKERKNCIIRNLLIIRQMKEKLRRKCTTSSR